jgi:hypothetical protein
MSLFLYTIGMIVGCAVIGWVAWKYAHDGDRMLPRH